MKPRKHTRFIVIHNLATSPSMDWGWKEVDRLHRGKGWLMGGYHYVIKRDGTVEEGRPLEVPGAHVAGHNHESVGIALAGGIAEETMDTDRGFRALPNVPENNFTPEQHKALDALVSYLRKFYPDAKVKGHCDLDRKKPHCPGFPLTRFH